MRDPNRIPVIIAKLQDLWQRCPDMRLCQLVSNITYNDGHDIFHIEDDFFETRLHEFSQRLVDQTLRKS